MKRSHVALGIAVGTSVHEVLARHGDPDETSSDSSGNVCLSYERLGLVVWVGRPPDSRVRALLLGRTRVHQDANGNVR